MERFNTLTPKPMKPYKLDKLTMVFSFFLTENFENKRYNKIHGYFIDKYSNVFDEVRITILIDDIENTELINSCKKWFVDKIHCNDVVFKVRKNTYNCESAVFMEEIASKMDELCGLCFFGHNKGISIYELYPECKDNIDIWVAGLWYLNLNFLDEVKYNLMFYKHIMYGAFMTDESNSDTFEKAKTHYAGTFYWINPSSYTITYGHNIHLLSERWFAEDFPIHIMPELKYSHKFWYIYTIDYYSSIGNYINSFFNEDELPDFYKTLDEIKRLYD